MKYSTFVLVTLLAVAGLPLLRATDPAESGPQDEAVPGPARAEQETLIAVAPPPFSEDVFPCSECHLPDDEVDTEPHEVDFHETVVFEHDAENRWCLDCHDTKTRDKLHLADGRLIGFEESYRLCGQCHGTHLRDWRAGEHGKRTGSWSGTKQYLLCAHCHDPHSPGIKPIEPMPAPIRQEDLR
jgi:hypothetical protein